METSGIKKVRGKVTVDSVEQHAYKNSLYQAQIRQEITTIYPSARIDNSMADSLFSADSFGLDDGKAYTSTRVTWIPVPKGTTVAQVEAQLAANPNAAIYRVLSHEPILTDNQLNAIESGLLDLDTVKNRQQIINPETGEVVLHNGKAQYGANFFTMTGKEDIDMRDQLAEEAPFSLSETKVATTSPIHKMCFSGVAFENMT